MQTLFEVSFLEWIALKTGVYQTETKCLTMFIVYLVYLKSDGCISLIPFV